MNDFTKEEIKEHVKESIKKWRQYFDSLDDEDKRADSSSDWEPMHIGCRDAE